MYVLFHFIPLISCKSYTFSLFISFHYLFMSTSIKRCRTVMAHKSLVEYRDVVPEFATRGNT